jgi:hypothetical protein
LTYTLIVPFISFTPHKENPCNIREEKHQQESAHKVWNDWDDEDDMLEINPEYRLDF